MLQQNKDPCVKLSKESENNNLILSRGRQQWLWQCQCQRWRQPYVKGATVIVHTDLLYYLTLGQELQILQNNIIIELNFW
jgi:hypothetical protein